MNKKLISTKMKMFIIGLLILSIIFYTSGCIILVKSNYKLSDYTNEINFRASSFSNNFFNFINSSSSHDYNIDDDISEINFNINSQDISVVNTDSELLNVSINGFSAPNIQMNLSKNNNKMIFSSNVDIPDYTDIIISIPKSISDKIMLKITTRNGNININNFSYNSINLSSASGDICLKNSNLNYIYSSTSSGDIILDSVTSYIETNLSCLSGSIDGTGNFGTLTGSTSSGDISLAFIDSLQNVFLNSTSGDITLSLPSKLGYEINYSTIYGDLNSNNDLLINGDKSNKLNVNTTSGDLNINNI